jgi:hypothetical protein
MDAINTITMNSKELSPIAPKKKTMFNLGFTCYWLLEFTTSISITPCHNR